MSSRAVIFGALCVLTLAACGERSATSEPKRSAEVDGAAAPASSPAKSAPGNSGPIADAPATSGSVQSASEREALIEPSRDLGGVLPLKHGIFVSADIPCGDPPNAALRRYDGEGLSGAHTHACQIKVLARHGASYDIEQSCIDAGQGPGPRSTEKATIDIQDNLTFALKRGGEGETFRYCPASMLPPALRNW
jgi:hypothetical protein